MILYVRRDDDLVQKSIIWKQPEVEEQFYVLAFGILSHTMHAVIFCYSIS